MGTLLNIPRDPGDRVGGGVLPCVCVGGGEPQGGSVVFKADPSSICPWGNCCRSSLRETVVGTPALEGRPGHRCPLQGRASGRLPAEEAATLPSLPEDGAAPSLLCHSVRGQTGLLGPPPNSLRETSLSSGRPRPPPTQDRCGGEPAAPARPSFL